MKLCRLTYKAIAEALKVSPASVSFAVKNKPGISDELRRRITEYIEQHDLASEPHLSRLRALLPSATEMSKLTLKNSRLKNEMLSISKLIREAATIGNNLIYLNQSSYQCFNTIRQLLESKGYSIHETDSTIIIDWSGK